MKRKQLEQMACKKRKRQLAGATRFSGAKTVTNAMITAQASRCSSAVLRAMLGLKP